MYIYILYILYTVYIVVEIYCTPFPERHFFSYSANLSASVGGLATHNTLFGERFPTAWYIYKFIDTDKTYSIHVYPTRSRTKTLTSPIPIYILKEIKVNTTLITFSMVTTYVFLREEVNTATTWKCDILRRDFLKTNTFRFTYLSAIWLLFNLKKTNKCHFRKRFISSRAI